MAKISFYLRNPNAQGLSPVTVRHSHKGSNFPLACGESVLEALFDKKEGQVNEKHPDCAKINNGIRHIVSRMEQARDACKQNKVEPVRENMEHYYNLLVRGEVVKAETGRLRDTVLTPKVMVPGLRMELAERELEIQRIKGLLRELDPAVSGDLLTVWFNQYAIDRFDLSKNSLKVIKQCSDRTKKFNPVWRIQEVNEETLKEFERWMLQRNYSHNTTILTLERLKAVCKEYGKKLKLDLEEIRHHRRQTKSVKANKNGMVRLTEKQIQALLDLDLKGEQARSRDQFVFLCLTGLRYCESLFLTEDDVRFRINEDGDVDETKRVLYLTIPKTGRLQEVPLSDKVYNLLVRNQFDFIRKKWDAKTGERINVKDFEKSSNFNNAIRTICKKIDSLQMTINLLSQKGGRRTRSWLPSTKRSVPTAGANQW